jgi:signal transduction histidine kinase
MSGLQRALVGLAVAGVVVGLAALALVTSNTRQPVPWQLALTLGWGLIGAGLYAWWRRPENRVGALMALAGFLWFLGALQSADIAWAYTLGLAVSSLWIGALVHMLVAFPDGRVAPGLERAVVRFGWLAAGVLAPLTLLFDAHPDECAGCPENVLLVWDDETLATIVEATAVIVAVSLLVPLAAILIRRWRSSGPVQRRALTPVVGTGAAIAVTAVLLLLLTAVGADAVSRVADAVLLLLTIAVPFAFLAGLMRSSLSRAGAVSALLERLGGGGTRDALAAALGDDTLALAYWLPDQHRFVDADGRTVDLPRDGGRAVTEIERDGARVAAIVHDPALLEDRELVRTAGAAAALALENERLAAEVRARYDDLRAASARLVAAGDAARRRIERDLHDGAQQRLVSLSVTLNLARKQAEPDTRIATLLDSAMAELTAGLAELRELARGIHPAVLTERGLEPALESLAARSPVPVVVDLVIEERLPGAVEAAAYFVVMEALTNVAKYASAESAEVVVREGAREVVVEVRDDGVGGADPRAGSGLAGLADRVAALGGRLGVESPPGGGTVVRAVLPARRSQRTT